jgi:predicted transposase/invertase (TIGR01784 family)
VSFFLENWLKKCYNSGNTRCYKLTCILEDLTESMSKLKHAAEKEIIKQKDYIFIKYWTVQVFEIMLEKARKRGTLVNEKEANRIMLMVSDEMMTGYDIYKDLELSKAEGRAEGRAEGIAEGMAEGERKGVTETALNMLKLNIPADLISQCTGFSLEKIEELRKQI